jgi:ABC-type branched-subunit amino acid transport system substrate-binding protein
MKKEMKKNLPYFILGGIVIVLLILSLVGVFDSNKGENTIKIGSILILSGEGSSWGTSEQNGIDMAVEKINLDGGLMEKLY